MELPDGQDDITHRLDAALDGVALSAPSTTKFNQLVQLIADAAETPIARVYAAYISKPGNLSVRLGQSPSSQAALVKVALSDSAEADSPYEAAIKNVREGKSDAIVVIERAVGHWRVAGFVAARRPNDDPDIVPLERLSHALATRIEFVESTKDFEAPAGTRRARNAAVPVVAATPLEIDPRVLRMVRLAIATHPAVLLVGPPGTGKSTLIAQIRNEIAADPAAYGMTMPHEILSVTPDESWGTRELVGGESVDDSGRLRFSPGWVLEAISEDRWLALDEVNRADMDRIFGGLLTWLAGQEVVVGRTGPESGAGAIRLGWAETAESQVDGLEFLGAEDSGIDPVVYQAGREWRLLGTYNSLDAHRVFRLGMALGRRFRQVPVPAPEIDTFTRALTPRLDPLPHEIREGIASAITAMYAAHLNSDAIALGPALFLDLPSYVAAGMPSGAPAPELLSEAYLLSVGPLLARLEEDSLDALGVALSQADVLGDGWQWVRIQLRALA
ncbi:AAA family ATPase [Paractinoplanes brasiliensis]|uniref:Dynein-related subfamily AAA family protein n=1 Tax=Paractinoplanes brasiliensis TaxID=52695 RepID=A0A4R6JVX3_9ACTN|nr:AAA family ATPase [Actinoplanes brasiliensis]TDO39306.1 dynein-related subfamily AAA family protein [Actinoplanes brasiliensis]